MSSISGSCTNTKFRNTEFHCKNDSCKIVHDCFAISVSEALCKTIAVLICLFSLIPEADCILIVVRGGKNQQVFKIQDGLVVHIKPGHISVKHFSWTQIFSHCGSWNPMPTKQPPNNLYVLQIAVDCIEVIFIRGRSLMYFKVFLVDSIPTGTILVTIGECSSLTYFLLKGLKVKTQIQFIYAQQVVFIHSTLAVFCTFLFSWQCVVISSS